MKSILIIFTGGTIGSTSDQGKINTNANTSYQLLEEFAKQFSAAKSVTFKTLHPLQILSENLHPRHWQHIIATIEAEDLRLYDGIIITHGTDTLAFSAAALGLYFNSLSIPLLIVSSDLPLGHTQANGLPNFICAVDFILQIRQGGVYVTYKNPGLNIHIYYATRIASCLQLSSDFIGLQSKVFMSYQDGVFHLENFADASACLPLKLFADFSARILLIRPYPGIDYDCLNLENVDAVLHDLYHSGTACTSAEFGEQHSLIKLVQRCRSRQLAIYLAPAIKSTTMYHTTQELLDEGAQIIWNVSLEVTYAKLLFAYSNFNTKLAIETFLAQDVALEHI